MNMGQVHKLWNYYYNEIIILYQVHAPEQEQERKVF